MLRDDNPLNAPSSITLMRLLSSHLQRIFISAPDLILHTDSETYSVISDGKAVNTFFPMDSM